MTNPKFRKPRADYSDFSELYNRLKVGDFAEFSLEVYSKRNVYRTLKNKGLVPSVDFIGAETKTKEGSPLSLFIKRISEKQAEV